MSDDSTRPLSRVIRIDEGEIRGHLDGLVRGTVEEALNRLLEAEADEMCQARVMSVRRSGLIRGPGTTRASCRRKRARWS